MKSKLMIIAISILFLFTSLSFAGQRDKGNKQKGNRQQENRQEKRYDNRGNQRYDARDFHRDRGLHQGHRHHIPDYQRHRQWRRWNEWDRDYRRNPHKYRGGYYHNDDRGNLVFTHCQDDRDSSTCISFGIYF